MKKKKVWPVAKGWIPVSESNWVNWSLWDNNVQFQRRTKNEGKWTTV